MDNSWTRDEKICYIAHAWADKEKDAEFENLQDYDFMDMAKAAAEFINSQPDNVYFLTHIENCFDVLIAEMEGRDSAEWTPQYFAKYY